MNPEIAEFNDHEIIKLVGELTIEHSEELREILKDGLDREERLSLSFSKVTDIDLSFLQLICSAHRTALQANKIFRIDKQGSEILMTAIKDAGFVREEGCSLDLSKSCIWKGRL